jgi:hypothetical protein
MVLAKDCAIEWESDRNVESTALSFVAFRCKKKVKLTLTVLSTQPNKKRHL